MLQRIQLFFCLIVLWALCSCATPVHEAFSKVSEGMDKAQVIKTLGDPTHSHRDKGKDIWVYRYYKDSQEYSRTVIFNFGKVEEIREEKQHPSKTMELQEANTYEEYKEEIKERRKNGN